MSEDEAKALRQEMLNRHLMPAERFLEIAPHEYAELDEPGCYLLVTNPQSMEDGDVTFTNVYIGQSIHALKRIRDYLQGHGNKKVKADIEAGRDVRVCVMPCIDDELNMLEIGLIEAFDAMSYANEAPGGAGRNTSERAQRTTWQMSLTVDEKEWIDGRSRELGLTMAGYVKRLVADDRRKVERERRRSK